MQISSFIGKPVLSAGGETFGYVTDVRLARDYKKLLCLVLADDEEEEIFLPMKTVRAVSDAVIAGKARLTSPLGIPSPVGKRAYTSGGKELGTVADVQLGETPCLVISDGHTADMVPASRVSVMETVIVYEDEKQRSSAQRSTGKRSAGACKKTAGHARRQKEVPEERPCDVPPVGEPLPQPEEPPEEPPVKNENANARQIGRFRTDLLGKYVQRPVYDSRGELLADAGTQITPALLSAARRAGKLLALSVNTLTAFRS